MRLQNTLSAALLAIASAASLGVTLAAPAPALAQSASDKQQAAELKKKGDAAMVSLRYEEAIDAYKKAYDITGDPALLYNRGRALQGLGQYPEALAQLESFKQQASPALKARVPALESLITEVRAKIATVLVLSNAKGARILVRSKVVGTTPLGGHIQLNAGPALVEVEAEGYLPFKKTVDLPGGGEIEIEAKLTLKSKMGVLTVRSPVAGARVFIDGKPAGNVPAERSLPAGPHKILVERDGYETAETTAVVNAGDKKQISIELKEKTSILKRWWFWASIGAVVAGGAVVTSAMIIERSPDVGDFDPGKISAPLRF
ncbi:MAG TPA: PEGA domain-containing protein [Polyangiaceae bacterium]|nr:PEGA domain-containing protein [Polyangiaceae bacterium]